MRKIVSSAAALAGTFLLAASPSAFAFGGHHRGGGMSAMRSCIAVMSTSQRANLKQTFSGEKQTWMTDHQNVSAAKKALANAILSGSKDVSSQEAALASAQQQLQKDQDATAAQVCSQLSSTQLSAAQTLFSNVSTLRANEHQQMHTYFEQAQSAAGNSQSSDNAPGSNGSQTE